MVKQVVFVRTNRKARTGYPHYEKSDEGYPYFGKGNAIITQVVEVKKSCRAKSHRRSKPRRK